MYKKRLPLVFIMLLVFIFSNTSEILAFKDVENHWSSEYVTVLSSKNIIMGYDDNTFKPDNNITRGEYYAIINRLANYTRTYAVSFSDVKRTDWFYEEVAKGIKAGYIMPTTGKLNPQREITREEAITILGYVFKLSPNISATENFKDKGSIKQDARGYIGALVDMKIIEGFPDGNIYPKKEITRGEISKILTLLLSDQGTPKNTFLVDSEIKFGPKSLYE